VKKKRNQPTLRIAWRLYQILGKEKIEKEGVMARFSTVSMAEFSEMIHLIDSKGKTPFEKQKNWTITVLSFQLEQFARFIREMFNGNRGRN
jgi:hypothetical protein